ncbi:hypothetical protein AMC75_00315 [Staphylococcus carnosus]|uniref:Uncharacterized protein n=1 Tax=Staphylococcus carnosus TaxID=1281 RepID=A0AAJ0JQI7_STACA|nr:hypothetical protein VV61_00305 [Staphylococcus carnosus]KOR13355.1 hypothetical protein AMC75_00315 [Staphylococcus carnosus]UTB78026.1 hypothetical protein A2I62_05475 [Staphylococcus carnosus]UTB83130.1 hypothetical protein A2I67_07330 [Staphylococcus carnosus]UTB87572.1 hypothetical protein A2I63_05465 [Staphylococcus carnosus]
MVNCSLKIKIYSNYIFITLIYVGMWLTQGIKVNILVIVLKKEITNTKQDLSFKNKIHILLKKDLTLLNNT